MAVTNAAIFSMVSGHVCADVEDTITEATRFGFGEPIAISAETGSSRSSPTLQICAARQLGEYCTGLNFGHAKPLRCTVAGEGLTDLYIAMQPTIDSVTEERKAQAEAVAQGSPSSASTQDQQIRLTIIGQPNVVRPCHLNNT